MKRPALITFLGYFFLLLGALMLLAAIPTLRMRGHYEWMGTWVKARTFMYWTLVQGGVWLFLSYGFFQGLTVAYYAYITLKLAHWGVLLMSGTAVGVDFVGLAVEAALLYAVTRHRAWFRNDALSV